MRPPFFDDGQVRLYLGHVLDVLREMPADSVQCVVTSPPYWALRAYGTEAQIWGGDPEHEHEWSVSRSAPQQGGPSDKQQSNQGSWHNGSEIGSCECGAWRGELGHEPTPQMFVAHLVEVFSEVRRVLKSDGVCWVNIGDSYNAYNGGAGPGAKLDKTRSAQRPDLASRFGLRAKALKPKDLVLIPERFALAMQDDGWYVRSRIAWCKRAPMPESVKDRPTSAWEHIWMLTKSARYFWDQEAVRETALQPLGEVKPVLGPKAGEYWGNGSSTLGTNQGPASRNMWSYWLLSPDPEPLAHFATFPKEIPRRCIAAATSEAGECSKCGRSWVRQTEREPTGRKQKLPSGMATYEGDHGSIHRDGRELTPTYSEEVTKRTTGWAPQCECNAPARPSTVLDPFIGSGTTTQIARSMLRRSIGIDLSEPYLRDIALRKNNQMALMPEPEAAS